MPESLVSASCVLELRVCIPMPIFVSLSRTAFVTGIASDLHLGSSCSVMRKVLSRVRAYTVP